MSVGAMCVCPSASLITCRRQSQEPDWTAPKDQSTMYVFSSIPWMYMQKAAVSAIFSKRDLVCDFPFEIYS